MPVREQSNNKKNMDIDIDRLKQHLSSGNKSTASACMGEIYQALETKVNNGENIGLVVQKIFSLLYCRDIQSSGFCWEFKEWVKESAISLGLSSEWYLLQEKMFFELSINEIKTALKNNLATLQELIDLFDEYLFLFVPLSEQIVRGILQGISDIVGMPEFGKNERTGMLLCHIDTSQNCFQSNPQALLDFIKTVEKEYPKFTEYSVCYNAVDMFVDCLPKEEALAVLNRASR